MRAESLNQIDGAVAYGRGFRANANARRRAGKNAVQPAPLPHFSFSHLLGGVLAVLLVGTWAAKAASVGPEGYTNSFDAQPTAADWATANLPGGSNDAYDMDATVNTNAVATSVTNATTASALNPPGVLGLATWSSSGLYLQTRAASSRYVMLMAKFVNNSGSNATEVAISYRLTIAGNQAAEDAEKGTRVYYSTTGRTGTWVNLPVFNTVASNGTYNLSTNLSLNWPVGTNLFLLWVDDNAVVATDVGNQIDDFSLRITDGNVPGLVGLLEAPTNNALFVAGAPVPSAVRVFNGTPPHVVRFWTNSGAGNTVFGEAGSVSAAPYELTLTGLTAGTWNLYATVTDAGGSGFTTNTVTNTFFVADPIAIAMVAPANGATIEYTNAVIGEATVAGGTMSYSVQFILDGVTNGPPVTSPPYTRDFGLLSIGNHSISATVTDARGWRSNAAPSTFRVRGPLSATFAPAGDVTNYARQALLLSAVPFAGDPPYTVSFFTNGQFIGSASAPPYSVNLGLMELGNYTVAMQVTDSSAPAQSIGVTSTVTVVASPPLGVSYAVQMSLDGLGAKYLEFFLTNAPAQFPNFVRLTREAAFTMNARCDFDISETVPNHATMFTARPVFQPEGQSNTVHHGYNNNFPGSGDTLHASGNPNVPYKFSMFDVTHDYGLSTALYTGKTRLSVCERSYNETNGAPDLIGNDNGRDKIDFASVADVSGANISNEVNLLITNLTSATPTNYTFIHIAEPDLTGHASGWRSANWSNIVREVDKQIGRIIEAIDGNPVLSNRTALVVTADHGGGGVIPNAHTESYHITNYTIPFFIRAPGIPGGADLYTLFANRADPGTNRTDYNTRPQAIRNGDASNLSLKMLGLPPITGSLMVPQFYAKEVGLSVARYQGQLGVFWADAESEYVLEAANSVEPGAPWQTIAEGIATNETTRVFSVTNAAELPFRFFRLRSLHQ